MITIIVPVYNSAEYLPDCFDSIILQSYRDYEVLVIDDGSTDVSDRNLDFFINFITLQESVCIPAVARL